MGGRTRASRHHGQRRRAAISVGLGQLLWPVVRLERFPSGLEPRLGLIEHCDIAKWRTGTEDGAILQPDARHALAGRADAADALAVFMDGVVVRADRPERRVMGGRSQEKIGRISEAVGRAGALDVNVRFTGTQQIEGRRCLTLPESS
jgi:hypothetical protein